MLSRPSDRWVEADGLEESSVLRLTQHGVLLSDDGDELRCAAATEVVCGQTSFSAAHVLIVLAARFERAFWKYRKHQRGLPPC